MTDDGRKGECQGNRDRCTLAYSTDSVAAVCPLFGTLGRPSRDGKRRIRGCGDAVARGKNSRRKGLAKQRDARKRLGVAPSHKFGDANEENWQDVMFANEVKAGKQIQPAVTAWLRIEAQVQSNDVAIGSRHKPCRAILMPDGWGKDGLVIVRLSTWEDLVRPALEGFYGEG